MGVCDVVASNLTMIYVAVMACVKAYGVVNGQSFGGGFVLTVSTILVALILVGTLSWDLSRKVKYYVFVGGHAHDDEHHHRIPRTHEVSSPCKGGICWHGVAERSPASQVRFRLPHHLPHITL